MGLPPAPLFADLPISIAFKVQWIGDGANDRLIPITGSRGEGAFVPDYIEVKRITAADPTASHFVSGWVLSGWHGCAAYDLAAAAVQSYVGAPANPYWQAPSTTNIQTGSSGADPKGANAAGITYEAHGFKYGI